MKIKLLILLIYIAFCEINGQTTILYDLDSYKRVDVNYRATFFSPDAVFDYDKVFNTPGTTKRYGINLGGNYQDYQIINDGDTQMTKNSFINLTIGSGDLGRLALDFNFEFSKRKYSGMKYFFHGYQLVSKRQNQFFIGNNTNKRFFVEPVLNYKIGFGFGRLEFINNAWLGARILQELESNVLLNTTPKPEDMKAFFDEIGRLEAERVMDSRLKYIYVVENIIEFIEDKEWIDKGEIKAFLVINDAYRFEQFFSRYSGKRLEFKLQSKLSAFYNWEQNVGSALSNYYQPGFEGNIEYEVHSNGDLQFYTSKLIGGRIGYDRRYRREPNIDEGFIIGDIYFESNYRYILSRRTNLSFSTDLAAGFVDGDDYNARLTISSDFVYNYYISPATQFTLLANLRYADDEFQIGDYQPRIDTRFSIDIRHAIR